MEEDPGFLEFCQQLLLCQSNQEHLWTGSFFELPVQYFFDNITDFDTIAYPKDICALPLTATVPSFQGLILRIQSEGSHKGFAKLVKSQSPEGYKSYSRQQLRKDYVRWPAWEADLIKVTDMRDFFNCLRTYSMRASSFDKLTMDWVDAIFCPFWPEEANEWTSRNRENGWPSDDMLERVIRTGCFLVAKPHQSNPGNENEWRFSFSKAELILIHSWNDVQKYVYHILRLMKSDVVKKCGGKERTVLSTYHIKTLMLWACEQKPREFWYENNMRASVEELLCNMMEWLIDKQCRNYFIPGNNMIDHLPNDQDLTLEVQGLSSAINYINVYFDSTVPLCKGTLDSKSQQTRISIPNKLFLTLQLRFSHAHIVDPNIVTRQTYSAKNVIEKTHLFVHESGLKDIYEGLTIHRRLVLSDHKVEQKVSDVQKAKDCFKRALEMQICSHTDVDICLFDNAHAITKTLLRTTPGRPGRGYHNLSEKCAELQPETTTDKLKQFESYPIVKFCDWSKSYGENDQDLPHNETEITSFRHTSARETNKCQSDSDKHTHQQTWNDAANSPSGANWLGFISSLAFEKLNEEIENPSSFIAAAYLANFYYAALNSYGEAFEMCGKWLVTAETVTKRFTAWIAISDELLPIILTNKWSFVFDKQMQTVLGLLTLFNAFKSVDLNTRQLLEKDLSLDIVIHVNPLQFVKYIRIQCTRRLVEQEFGCSIFDDEDEISLFKVSADLSGFVLYAAARTW